MLRTESPDTRHVMVEAEFHAVRVSPEGQYVDITPKPHTEATTLFVPDARRTYTGVVIDNIALPNIFAANRLDGVSTP